MSLSNTPRGSRLHIGIFGKRNSGKSSLINTITNQEISIVSNVAGTTTDPVYKSMELYGVGPCVFIDTPGFDDVGDLGKMRVEKTIQAGRKTDIALIIFSGDDFSEELYWINFFLKQNTPVVPIINMWNMLDDVEDMKLRIGKITKIKPLVVSAKSKDSIDAIHKEIKKQLPTEDETHIVSESLAREGDVVLLVMPQDIQAPKGRLILPQVQVIRELLDRKCVVVSTTTDKIDNTLSSLVNPPNLIITDSQVFKTVFKKKPKESKLTSFSILFAAHKGNINVFKEGAKAINNLTKDSKVLIAEACTHAPLEEDIGSVKIPNMLRKRIGEEIHISMVSGVDFPDDISKYDLIIHCGACMFNRKHVLARVESANNQNVPITNYGIALAFLTGIFDYIDWN